MEVPFKGPGGEGGTVHHEPRTKRTREPQALLAPSGWVRGALGLGQPSNFDFTSEAQKLGWEVTRKRKDAGPRRTREKRRRPQPLLLSAPHAAPGVSPNAHGARAARLGGRSGAHGLSRGRGEGRGAAGASGREGAGRWGPTLARAGGKRRALRPRRGRPLAAAAGARLRLERAGGAGAGCGVGGGAGRSAEEGGGGGGGGACGGREGGWHPACK